MSVRKTISIQTKTSLSFPQSFHLKILNIFCGKMNHRKANKYFPKRRVWDGIHLVIWTGVVTATNDDTSFELISILTWPSSFITFIFSSAVGCFKIHLTISQLLSEYYVSERDEMDGVTFQRDSPPLSDAKHCHC